MTLGRQFGLPWRRRVSRDERGTVLVEFAFVLPLLLVLVLGMMDFGQAFNYWVDETHLSNEAARYAAVDRPPTSDKLQTWVRNQASTQELNDNIGVAVSFGANGQKVGEPLTVTTCINYNWMPFLAGWIPGFNATTKITGHATMRIERLGTPPAVQDTDNIVGSCG
jgi:Flp pilus assembly protein TadG